MLLGPFIIADQEAGDARVRSGASLRRYLGREGDGVTPGESESRLGLRRLASSVVSRNDL